jgi:capsular exopolysaccharide synthesis family protein
MINFAEILWKPKRAGETGAAHAGPATSDSFREPSRLQQLPVEEARIAPDSRIVLMTDPHSPGADRYRFLRMRLRELKESVSIQKLLITSALPQDGKSTTVLNLATTLAEQGKYSVLVLEADLYHPTLSEKLGIPDRPGLAECLEQDLDPMLALRRIEPVGWYLLTGGTARGNPTELLQSEPLTGVIEKLTPYFDWILFDTPPVGPLSDAVSLQRYVDASMLVVRADRTPQEAVKQAVTLLGPKHVLGIIFNAARGLNRAYSAYYGYYQKR